MMKTHTKKEIANFAISLFTLDPSFFLWALTDSNRRPSACKADALNQLS